MLVTGLSTAAATQLSSFHQTQRQARSEGPAAPSHKPCVLSPREFALRRRQPALPGTPHSVEVVAVSEVSLDLHSTY